MARNVVVVYDEDLDKVYPRQYSSIVVVRTRDRRTLQRRVDWPKGSPQNPLTDAELTDKYMSMATQRCHEEQARRIAELVLNIEQVDDARTLGTAVSLST